MIRNYSVEIIKEFFMFFTPALVWGLYFHKGTALFIFLFSVSSAIFGYSAATRWIESAQEGSLSLKPGISDEELARRREAQTRLNSCAACCAAISAMLVAALQLVPVAKLYMDFMNS